MKRAFTLSCLMVSMLSCSRTPPKPLLSNEQVANDRKPISLVKTTSDLKMGEFTEANTFGRLAPLADPRTYVKGIASSFGRRGGLEAANVNFYDDVADSTWFTHRNDRQPMPLTILQNGVSSIGRLETSKPLRVVGGKTSGVSPGFIVKDANDARFLLKFDSSEYCGLSTGADVLGTRLFYAAGYNVPQNQIEFIDPARFELDLKATTKDSLGNKVPFTQERFAKLLARLPNCKKDGKVRMMASRFLPGKPVGPFSYQGKRSDDDNDRISHEDRRELRALYVLSAWINNTDFRDYNTLDMFQETAPGKGFLLHHILDLGGSFGHAALYPRDNYGGHVYLVDYEDVALNLVSLGLREPDWRQDVPIQYRSIGNFHAERFDPGDWKPTHPHPIERTLTNRDGFWGARIVASFTDEQIRAAVLGAQLPEAGATEEMTNILAMRRNITARYWFSRVGSLDRFEVLGDLPSLRFMDWSVAGAWKRFERVSYRVLIKGKGMSVKKVIDTPALSLFADQAAYEAWKKRAHSPEDRTIRVRFSPIRQLPAGVMRIPETTRERRAGPDTEAIFYWADDGSWYWIGVRRFSHA